MSAYEPLDIAACYGTDLTSKVIRYGTASVFGPKRLKVGPSHVAVLTRHEGHMKWAESTTMCKHRCEYSGKHVSGAQLHTPAHRIKDYVDGGGRVEIYRLTPIDSLSQQEAKLADSLLIDHFIAPGIQYDTGGAILSGTRVLKFSRLFPGADLNHLFCSEMVAAVLQRLGRMNRDNPTKYNPACLLRALVRQGTYRYLRTYEGTE